jgi:uncharacterized membrane protein
MELFHQEGLGERLKMISKIIALLGFLVIIVGGIILYLGYLNPIISFGIMGLGLIILIISFWLVYREARELQKRMIAMNIKV